MRTPDMRILVLLAGFTVMGSCAITNLGEGAACDPTLASRDCDVGLECVYSYDECPQYGCPRCRLPCQSDADCTASACAAPVCVRDTNSTLQDRGLCKVCLENPYYGPP